MVNKSQSNNIREKKKRFKIKVLHGQLDMQTIWDYLIWRKPIEIILEEIIEIPDQLLTFKSKGDLIEVLKSLSKDEVVLLGYVDDEDIVRRVVKQDILQAVESKAIRQAVEQALKSVELDSSSFPPAGIYTLEELDKKIAYVIGYNQAVEDQRKNHKEVLEKK